MTQSFASSIIITFIVSIYTTFLTNAYYMPSEVRERSTCRLYTMRQWYIWCVVLLITQHMIFMLANSLDLCCALHINDIHLCSYNTALNLCARLRLTLFCRELWGFFFLMCETYAIVEWTESRWIKDVEGHVLYSYWLHIKRLHIFNHISVVFLRMMRMKRDLILLMLLSLCGAQKKGTQETWEHRGNSFLY